MDCFLEMVLFLGVCDDSKKLGVNFFAFAFGESFAFLILYSIFHCCAFEALVRGLFDTVETVCTLCSLGRKDEGKGQKEGKFFFKETY